MNPFSKSVWITPAAYGANHPCLTVHALTSSSPQVKKLIKSNALKPFFIIFDS